MWVVGWGGWFYPAWASLLARANTGWHRAAWPRSSLGGQPVQPRLRRYNERTWWPQTGVSGAAITFLALSH